MEFTANMVDKNGNKMMYLFTLAVKKDSPYYDEIWAELNRRMNNVSIPIVRVDWLLADDDGGWHDYSEDLFYAQTFEIGMGFINGILNNHKIRSNLECCDFFSGDCYKGNNHRYDGENTIEAKKNFFNRHHPDEEW